MLTKTESKIMNVLYSECENKSALLITPIDIMKMSGEKNVTLSVVEKTVSALNMDGYLDLVYSDRHGETVYCISLTEKGKAYKRGRKVFYRNLAFRLAFTVGLAVLSFLIGIILKAVFT